MPAAGPFSELLSETLLHGMQALEEKARAKLFELLKQQPPSITGSVFSTTVRPTRALASDPHCSPPHRLEVAGQEAEEEEAEDEQVRQYGYQQQLSADICNELRLPWSWGHASSWF